MSRQIGWVKIHRSITESYYSEPFCRTMAWIDLILLANHKPAFIRKRGIRVDLKRGDIGTGSIELAKRWRWSRGKVLRFLNELESDQQIIQQKNNITNCITIVNYERYQNDGTADGQQIEQQTVQQTDTKQDSKRYKNKNVKNDNNEKNVKKEKNNTGELFEKISFPWNSNQFLESWNRWKDYKKNQFNFSYKSEVSEQAALYDLSKMAGGFEKTAIEIINQSLAKGWKGLFELKINGNGKQSTVEAQREGLKAEFSNRFRNGQQATTGQNS